jgi:predicted RNA-binding protein with PIN domain
MSYIIIDGYNVTGISHKDMEKARDALLSQLATYRKGNAHDITVVFDGYKSGMSTQQGSFFHNIKVIYTRLGERADDVIKKMVSQHRKEWIVITADRDIVDHVWSAGSIPVPPDRFMAIVEKGGRPAPDEIMPEADEEDDDYGSHDRKGNAYKLSKKEKALRRALSKL